MERTIYAEMSEWFKEHDWKSCVRLKRTGGSNPLLCARKKRYTDVYLFSMAQRRGFEPPVRFRRTHDFQGVGMMQVPAPFLLIGGRSR